MSKKDQPSKYLASFYTTPGGQAASGNVQSGASGSKPGEDHRPAQNPNPIGPNDRKMTGVGGGVLVSGSGVRSKTFMPKISSLPGAKLPGSQKPVDNVSSAVFEADKFKKPGDFFKSQSMSSQMMSSQNRVANRTSFGGGSTHEMLSQSFQVKKPQMTVAGPSGCQKPVGGQMRPIVQAPRPTLGFNAKFPQRKSLVVMNKDIASTNALQLQWTQKMCQKKDGLPGNLDKRNLTRTEGKSPLGKSLWADSSFTKPKDACKNQQNDPWYSNDVWGDDLPEEAVDACLELATQVQNKDPLSSWMDENWASPKKSQPPKTSVKTSLFSESKSRPKQSDLMDLLAGDDDFMALVENVEAQPVKAKSAAEFSLSRKVLQPVQDRKSVPFSERMPVTGTKSSFVIKAKEFESPSKQETLTQSQRTFRKPVKSLPSPSTKMLFTTEWLRGQLEKISSEYSTLKEDVQVKEGESKLLREKLKSAEEEAQKHKLDKARELEKLRRDYETKVKILEKQLEATQTQAMFKAKEAESSLEKYRELKTIAVKTPEPAKCQSFKNIPSIGPKPVEVLADETVEETVSEELINATVNIFETPKKTVEPSVAGTPEKSMFDDSPSKPCVGSPCEANMPEKSMFEDSPSKPCVGSPCEVNIQVKSYVLPKKHIFDDSVVKSNEAFRRAAAQVVHGRQPKKEMNHFLMLPMEYLPHMLLQTEFSEQEVENYLVRRPTLVELWGVPYDAFGGAVLDDYERAAVGDEIAADPARTILSKSRYFSTMEPVHGCLLSLADATGWGPVEWKMATRVVDLATDMARELYATLGDPRLLRTTYTIYDRDPKILSAFLDSSELKETFSAISPDKWKNESFVELRRCLVMIGHLCAVDHMTARYIVNPKANNSRDFHTQKEDANFVRMTVNKGERKQSELKLKQMYRDLHSKKLTLAADLANALTVNNTPSFTVPMEMDTDSEPTKALHSALEKSKNDSVLRSDVPSNKKHNTHNISFDEFQKFVSGFGLMLKDVQNVVKRLQGELNPPKVAMLKSITNKVERESRLTFRVSVPKRLFDVAGSDIVEATGDYAILGAPVDKCISLLEKQIMIMALSNSKALKNVFERVGVSSPSDLDLTRYVASDGECEVNRKRKISVEDVEPRKLKKVDDYETPPFDELYTQMKGPEAVIAETQHEDDQLAKFEKREEIAELKKKMLAEEKKKKHALAPVRIPGRNSPTNEDSADKEVAMEIEKMFQTQVRTDMDESMWSEPEEEPETRTLTVNDDDVAIEVIPELVKHFHNKLQNAGLLELLCEVFKDGGVLRFTHRLNGVMLGTVIMLQNIVKYQKTEVEHCQSKLATIIREILYTRPSPRVVFEVNVLLRYAVTCSGFGKMLCHNASPETFVTSHELVYFTRGACLLEVVCILMTYATEEDTDCAVYLEMIHWVYYIVCTEKKHMASLYEQHHTDQRRCMCITALNNTIVMICHRAVSLYRRLVDTGANPGGHPEKIFVSGLQILRIVYSYGPLSFLYTIRTQYLEYRQVLTWLRDMHVSAVYKFQLSPAYLYIVSELLKDNRDPNNHHEPPVYKDLPDLKMYFPEGKPSPYDNAESSLKADSSESEDE